jgi:lysophospholipase L1-like esterase
VEQARETNRLVQEYAAQTGGAVRYADVFTPMLGADGRPRPELYVEDGLHMSAAGYALWRDVLAPLVR